MSDIPSELKQLVRCVMRTFYGLIPRLIMDALMKYGSMQRDQLATLLKLDKNKIQAQLATLSGEKFIKTRIKMETTAAEESANGNSRRPLSAREQSQRTARHTFYFVNFRGFLNSVKYKLDHVRRRLEAQEKEAMYNRSLFRCLQCNHKYSELDVIRLFDRVRNAYFCYICQAELAEEGESNEPATASDTIAPGSAASANSTNGYASANSTASSTTRSNDSVPSKPSSDSSKSWSSQASNDEQIAPAIKPENGLRVKTEPNSASTTNGKAAQSVSDSPVKAEAASAAKNGDGNAFQKKSQVARFHEQTRSIVDLIRICERLDLTSVFAAAEISGYDAAQANANSNSNWGEMKPPRTASLFAAPSGVKREPNSGKGMRLNLNLVIEMDGMGQSNANATPKVKETPHWLKNDASGAFKSEPLATPLSPPPGSARSSLSFGFGASGATSPTPNTPTVDEERVKRLVFQREVMRTRRVEPSITSAPTIVKKERIDEQVDCSSLRFDWLNRPILAGGILRPFSSLTQKDVARMTEAERAEYVRIGQQLYELCD